MRTIGEKRWVLENGESAYALEIDGSGNLLQTYWGARLGAVTDYPGVLETAPFPFEPPNCRQPLAIVTGEGGVFAERTLDLNASSGIRGSQLRFSGARPEASRLEVDLIDAELGLEVTLHVEELSSSLMARWMTLRNSGNETIDIERAFSATFHLPACEGYGISQLDGRWGDEFRIRRNLMQNGVLARESRRLTTSHGGVPYFAVDKAANGEQATEERGELWFGTLQWSGNWKLLAERTAEGRHVVHLGVNDHDSIWQLGPRETWSTPRVLFGYTLGGHGTVSRALHDFVRNDLAPRRAYSPPVVYNSWYATLFNVDETGQTALAEAAAKMGIELFVVDDGWFSGRVTDRAGLGDWWPDQNKFPNGLGPLIDAVHGRGMGFGLWIEPEMVNPDSDLYRTHPDWILHFPGRHRTLMRNQSILNLGRPDVESYLIDIFDRLLTENAIDFIKWDMNRNIGEAGWPEAPRNPREVWVRYVEGLYRVWGELRRRHPRIIWENCSGGGGRVDMGMTAITEQSWISDNTLPAARLQIQEGYSRLFPASTMAAWVTDEEKDHYSLDFKFHVSMAGALGVGGNILNWSAAELEAAAGHIARYKEIRPLVVHGDLYRLRSPRESAISAFSYVAKDKSSAVVFLYRLRPGRITPELNIPLAGLDPDAPYSIDGGPARSGKAWSVLGLPVTLKDDQSAILSITRRA